MSRLRYSVNSGLVSIVSKVASGPRFSRIGRVKVPTPGPYSTNTLVSAQSTGASILSIRIRDEGMTDPTITGFFRKPRRNCQRGLAPRCAARRTNRRGPLSVRADDTDMEAPRGGEAASTGKCTATWQVWDRRVGRAIDAGAREASAFRD